MLSKEQAKGKMWGKNKMKQILLTNNDFSHKELKRCFSKKLLNLIESLDYYSELSEKKVDDFYFKIERMNLPQWQIDKLDKMIFTQKKIKKIKLDSFNRFNKKNSHSKRCLICNERTVHRCHVIKRNFFRNHKRLGKRLIDFEWHPLNILYLCPNHHHALDHDDLAKWRIKKIIRNRLKLRRAYMRDLREKIRKLRKNIKKLDKGDKKINKYVKKELSKVLR